MNQGNLLCQEVVEGLGGEWGPAGALQKGHGCDCGLCEFLAGEGCSELRAGVLLPTTCALPCASPAGPHSMFFFLYQHGSA